LRTRLGEIRRRAERNAAHIASNTESTNGRDLVDDIVMAAWLVLHKNADKVGTAALPWAYVMSSAQRTCQQTYAPNNYLQAPHPSGVEPEPPHHAPSIPSPPQPR
jgi:hypothetical protein